jgi:DNA-directed RNA polymerase specialized sigma24 family protein
MSITDPTTEKSDLRAVTSGDAEAFGRIYERYRGMVLSLALRLTGAIDVAQVIEQEVFLSFYRKASALDRSGEDLGSWFRRQTSALVQDRAGRKERPSQDDQLRLRDTAPEKETSEALAFGSSGLLGPDGRPIGANTGAYKLIVDDVTQVTANLLSRLADEPEELYSISPRQFEQVVAELLARQGYDITLTPASKDGGKDIYAATKTVLGTFLYVVECKKYSPDHPVGVGLVRQLYGVVQQEKATAGILITTSFFTKPAKEFQGQAAFQISLRDFFEIRKWLDEVTKLL